MNHCCIFAVCTLLAACNVNVDTPPELAAANDRVKRVAQAVGSPIEALGVNTLKVVDDAQAPLAEAGKTTVSMAKATSTALENLGTKVIVLTSDEQPSEEVPSDRPKPE